MQELQKKLQFSDQALYNYNPPLLPATLGQFLNALNNTASETGIGFLLIEIIERQINHMIMATRYQVAISYLSGTVRISNFCQFHLPHSIQEDL
jgi:hypothetical protein